MKAWISDTLWRLYQAGDSPFPISFLQAYRATVIASRVVDRDWSADPSSMGIDTAEAGEWTRRFEAQAVTSQSPFCVCQAGDVFSRAGRLSIPDISTFICDRRNLRPREGPLKLVMLPLLFQAEVCAVPSDLESEVLSRPRVLPEEAQSWNDETVGAKGFARQGDACPFLRVSGTSGPLTRLRIRRDFVGDQVQPMPPTPSEVVTQAVEDHGERDREYKGRGLYVTSVEGWGLQACKPASPDLIPKSKCQTEFQDQ